MGDVAGRSRGQLLILTALAIAVLLALLTLALNTAVFGGAYVAQADDGPREERAALQFQGAVRRGVAGLIPAVNERHAEYDALEGGLVDGVANWTEVASGEYARDGVATNASASGVTFETRVVDNDSGGQFTDQSGNADWTVAANVSEARGYEMNVSDSDLVAGNCTGSNGCFGLTVEGANGNGWRLFVHDDDGDADVDLTVETANGTTETCESGGVPARINVSRGAVDGTECFTAFGDDPDLDPPYTLQYADANNVSGTYNLTVEGRLVGGKIGSDGSEGDSRYGTTGSPRLDPRIDAANVSVQYRSLELTYRTSIRVVPEGEGDD